MNVEPQNKLLTSVARPMGLACPTEKHETFEPTEVTKDPKPFAPVL